MESEEHISHHKHLPSISILNFDTLKANTWFEIEAVIH